MTTAKKLNELRALWEQQKAEDDALADPDSLYVTIKVNGVKRQRSLGQLLRMYEEKKAAE